MRLALLNKEKAELFLNNLKGLFDNKTINEASFKILKEEYASNLQRAQTKVDLIKQELNKRLSLKTRELDIYKQELANLEARFKVGQLSAGDFIKQSRIPEKKVNALEDQVNEINSLISSQHSSEIADGESSGIGALFTSRNKQVKRPVNIQTPAELPTAIEPPVPPPPTPVIDDIVSVPTPPPPDPTNISNLMILPDKVLPGSTVGVIATVTNSGKQATYHRTQFKINDSVVSVNEIMLEPDQSEEITFMTVAGKPGDYNISVDDATGTLHVLPTI